MDRQIDRQIDIYIYIYTCTYIYYSENFLYTRRQGVSLIYIYIYIYRYIQIDRQIDRYICAYIYQFENVLYTRRQGRSLIYIYKYRYISIQINIYVHIYISSRMSYTPGVKVYHRQILKPHIHYLRLVGSLKSQVSFAKKPCKRDYILQKRPTILRSLLIIATQQTEFDALYLLLTILLSAYTYMHMIYVIDTLISDFFCPKKWLIYDICVQIYILQIYMYILYTCIHGFNV